MSNKTQVDISPRAPLLKGINFDPSMDKMPNKVFDEINYPFPNVNVCNVDVWGGWVLDVIIYPCWE